ncbi:hypothetical protein C8Q80DRAFT_1269910 [Daedaleopsis nitida]|nr:hypothetical protein C8Q80DRAFT_1269910 [Daedaleopsis nitida]
MDRHIRNGTASLVEGVEHPTTYRGSRHVITLFVSGTCDLYGGAAPRVTTSHHSRSSTVAGSTVDRAISDREPSKCGHPTPTPDSPSTGPIIPCTDLPDLDSRDTIIDTTHCEDIRLVQARRVVMCAAIVMPARPVAVGSTVELIPIYPDNAHFLAPSFFDPTFVARETIVKGPVTHTLTVERGVVTFLVANSDTTRSNIAFAHVSIQYRPHASFNLSPWLRLSHQLRPSRLPNSRILPLHTKCTIIRLEPEPVNAASLECDVDEHAVRPCTRRPDTPMQDDTHHAAPPRVRSRSMSIVSDVPTTASTGRDIRNNWIV